LTTVTNPDPVVREVEIADDQTEGATSRYYRVRYNP
jgi:hypothetical protein